MSNYNSGLPVRSEADGTDEKVIVKVIDGTNGGTNQMTVDADKKAHVKSHGIDPAGLTVTQRLTEEGRTTSNGDYHATTNTKPSSNAVILHDRVATPTEVDQNFRPTGVASSVDNAKCADVAIRDEAGNPFTTSNPLPVTLVDSEGDEVNDPFTSANVPAGGTVTHDYPITALKTGKLNQVMAAGSGKLQVDVSVETGVAAGTYTRKFTKFNSTANPNVEFDLKELITVAAGVKVRVSLTNLDKQPFDVYSTISLHEI